MDWTSPHHAILAALWGPKGGFEIIDAAAHAPPPRDRITLALDTAGALPPLHSGYDLALTSAASAPLPWVSVAPGAVEAVAERLALRAAATPVAAAVARFVFRLSPTLPFEDALELESLAYSMLLASAEFDAWRARNPGSAKQGGDERVRVSESSAGWVLELNRPEARNAFDARMRDALADVLEGLYADASGAPIELRGAGPAFSAGGDLAEFGQAADPALAHLIRARQSPTRLIYAMRARVVARIHGACIGAGIEVPAAAGRVVATPDAFMRLPEVGMGLIPGAGGCASIPRRIGAARAFYLALSGVDLDAPTALAWGLVDAIEDAS